MKKQELLIMSATAILLVNSGCGTIFGGRIDKCQTIKGESGTPTRSIRPAALVFDILAFPGSLLWVGIDFIDGAMYKPCTAYPNPHQAYSAPTNTVPQQNTSQTNSQPSMQIKLGDKVMWQDLNNKKFYPGVVVGQGDGTWLIKDDDDGKIYPINASQVSLEQMPAQSNPQHAVQIKLGDKVMWQDLNNKKFYPGVVEGQGDGTWLIKDDDDGKIYPVSASQIYLSK